MSCPSHDAKVWLIKKKSEGWMFCRRRSLLKNWNSSTFQKTYFCSAVGMCLHKCCSEPKATTHMTDIFYFLQKCCCCFLFFFQVSEGVRRWCIDAVKLHEMKQMLCVQRSGSWRLKTSFFFLSPEVTLFKSKWCFITSQLLFSPRVTWSNLYRVKEPCVCSR